MSGSRGALLGSVAAVLGVGGLACDRPGNAERPGNATGGDPGPPSAAAEVEFAGPSGSAEPNLTLLSDGRVALTWHEPVAEGRFALRLAIRSADGWSGPLTVRVSERFFVNWADFPSLAETADGAWAVHWLEKVADATYAYHVRIALSRDGGRSWSEPLTPHRDGSPTEHGFVSMVPWGEREVALVWLDGRLMEPEAGIASGGNADDAQGQAGPMTLRFTILRSDRSLGPELRVDGRTCECCQTSLVRTAGGLLAAYRDRGPDEVRDIRVTRYADGYWGEPILVADEGWRIPGCPVNGPQLDAAGDRVVVAWFTAADGRPVVKAAFSSDGGRRFGSPVRVDAGSPVGRVDVVLLADGSAAVSWVETQGDAALVMVRTVTEEGEAGQPVGVSATSAGRASGFPRLARTGEGLLVAWTLAGEGGGIRVARLRPDQE